MVWVRCGARGPRAALAQPRAAADGRAVTETLLLAWAAGAAAQS